MEERIGSCYRKARVLAFVKWNEAFRMVRNASFYL